MEFINYARLEKDFTTLQDFWNTRKPFRYVYGEGFFTPEAAELIYSNYPTIEGGKWDYTTYINQNNKFVMTKFENPVIRQAFDELNSRKLKDLFTRITGIDNLEDDDKLFGGGLHQSTTGAFLDVHVDFNFHPETKHHRRMNLIVFMNKDWKAEYNGFLELWDMQQKKQLEYISPDFNRWVIFETNEVSFHGHPKPLKTPAGISRKSLAIYYYTPTRPEHEIAGDHNTIYVHPESGSKTKNIKSALKAIKERLFK